MFNKLKPQKWALISALAIVGSNLCLFSQEEASFEDEDLFELSPFVIETDSNVGYLAKTTLAGTRIRTNLRDIGSSITVVTKELLKDTGSTNAEDIMVYLGNAEVNGLGGNFSNAYVGGGAINSTSGTRNATSATRIRGLGRADLTRDFFSTDIPFDAYNTERIVLNRGANSILFGLGSPAGVLNNSVVRPTFEEASNVEFQYGSFDSKRASFDFDKEIIDDVFAIRIAGLYDDEKYEQKPAYERDKRFHGAFEWRPTLFTNKGIMGRTSVRGSIEIGEIDSNRPRLTPPGDTISTWWTLANQQPVSHTLDWTDTNRNLYSIPGNWYFQLGVVYADEASTQFGSDGGSIPDAFVPLTPANLNNDGFLAGFRGIAPFQYYAGGLGNWPGQIENGSFYYSRLLSDRSIFDYRKKLLDGPNKSENADFEAYNIVIEQELLNGNAGIEFVYDKQSFSNGWYDMLDHTNGYSIQIDVNPYYPDGSANPNYGRPFSAAAPRAQHTNSEREVYRVTTYAKIDLEDKVDGIIGKILGRHNFTGLFSDSKVDGYEATFLGLGPDREFMSLMGRSDILNGNFGDARIVNYLGASLADRNSAAGANIPQITAVRELPSVVKNARYWNPTTQSWVTDSVKFTTYQDNPGGIAYSGDKTRETVESVALVWQSYWWDEMVVGTVGWRQDEFKSYGSPSPTRDPVDNHAMLDDPDFTIDTSETIGETKDSLLSWSVVFHTPEFINDKLPFGSNLSFHYNQSENFRPGTQRFNIVGDPVGTPQGETEDYGVTVSMFDGKLSASLNFFETSQNNIDLGAPSTRFMEQARGIWEAISAGINDDNPEVNNYYLPPQDILDFWGWTETPQPDGSVTVTTDPLGSITSVTSSVTKGLEFEVIYNPTNNWRIMFNASKQEATQSGLDAGFQQMLNERMPVWEQTGTLWATTALNFTAAQRRDLRVLKPWNFTRSQDGKAKNEVRKWRWNLITNYEFTESILSGFGVGGAVRWQDQPVIGFPVIYDDASAKSIFDINNPYYGDSELNADMWLTYQRMILDSKVDWKLKLTVRNLVGQDDLIPIVVQPDGSMAAGRITQSTMWTLSSSFSF